MRLKKKINNNKVAVVTGAGSGIGKAVALGLAKEGLDVYLAGRKKDRLLNTKQQSVNEKYRGRCHVIKCDVSKEADVRKVFLLIKKQHGRLDLLFNVSVGSERSLKLGCWFGDAGHYALKVVRPCSSERGCTALFAQR